MCALKFMLLQVLAACPPVQEHFAPGPQRAPRGPLGSAMEESVRALLGEWQPTSSRGA